MLNIIFKDENTLLKELQYVLKNGVMILKCVVELKVYNIKLLKYRQYYQIKIEFKIKLWDKIRAKFLSVYKYNNKSIHSHIHILYSYFIFIFTFIFYKPQNKAKLLLFQFYNITSWIPVLSWNYYQNKKLNEKNQKKEIENYLWRLNTGILKLWETM